MKKIKFLTENIIAKYGNINIIDTNHSIERGETRGEFTKEQKLKFLSNAIKDILKRHNEVYDNNYLVYSKSLNQGMILSYTPAYKNIRIVTVLPKGKQFAKPNTKKVIIEAVDNKVYKSFPKCVIEYLISISRFNINENNNYDCEIKQIPINNYNISFVICNNKIEALSIDTIVIR